jgi:Scaffold domain
MRSLPLILIVPFSVLVLILVVTREPTRASGLGAQQPAVSDGRTLTPAGASALHAIADSARNEDLHWPNFAPYKAEFSKFYQANGYSLAWLQNGQVRSQGLAVIEVLEHANSRGLEVEDYDARGE